MVAFKGTEVKFHIRWDVKITGILTFNLYLSYSQPTVFFVFFLKDIVTIF